MKPYEIYDWDETIQDWVWVGSDSGTIHFRPKDNHYGDDTTMAFWLAHHHSKGGKLDKEHFVDEDKIIDTELVTIRGEETYLSKEESFYLLMHNQIFMKNGKIMTDEEKLEYYQK